MNKYRNLTSLVNSLGISRSHLLNGAFIFIIFMMVISSFFIWGNSPNLHGYDKNSTYWYVSYNFDTEYGIIDNYDVIKLNKNYFSVVDIYDTLHGNINGMRVDFIDIKYFHKVTKECYDEYVVEKYKEKG